MKLCHAIFFISFVSAAATSVISDVACQGVPNGNYPLRDVFKFLTCYNNHATYTTCPKDTIYDPHKDACISLKGFVKRSFCRHRANSNWRNPWDCHGFIACVLSNTYFMKCAGSQLVYNPENDQCVDGNEYLCRQESAPSIIYESKEKEENNPCSRLSDGTFAIHDVFKYLICKGGNPSYSDCEINEIYEPGNGKCVSIKSQSIITFCENRTDGDWVNPWNCHRFLQCNRERTHNLPCPLNDLVFDPYRDGCVDKSQYKCRKIPDSGKPKALIDGDPCRFLADGQYAIRDVFRYMICKSNHATYKVCPKNFIYEPGQKSCVDVTSQNMQHFCQNRSDENWANPWNCHRYISCFVHYSRDMPCQSVDFVYYPAMDWCVRPNEQPCKQVTENKLSIQPVGPCAKLKDGKYATRNVFKYMICKSGKTSYNYCTGNTIFEPGHKDCVNINTQSEYTFCQNRSNGDYSNPWNCHYFFKCVFHKSYDFKQCDLKNLIYDPDSDSCVWPGQYPCIEIKSKTIDNAQDPCYNLDDGKYVTADMFSYLQCKAHKAHYIDCGRNEIFDESKKECVDGKTMSKEAFCLTRKDGNYQDPWNCHKFISCVSNHLYEQLCPGASAPLVYNPYKDRCEHHDEYPCKQLDNPKDPCYNLDDGKYVIADLFSYLQCKDHKAQYVDCGKNEIFDESKKECVDGKTMSKEAFCLTRKDGNYQDPWNCHKFISCVSNRLYEQLCPDASAPLVYNPYKDQCEHGDEYPCKQLTDGACSGKPDGNYPIPDVFKYLICKGGKSYEGTCPEREIFDSETLTCVTVNFQALSKFCDFRADGDWRNPWNCYGYIVCKNHTTMVTPCLLNGFVFNPYEDVCDQHGFPCKTIYGYRKGYHIAKAIDKDLNNHHPEVVADNPCATKPDGNYVIRDVFSYLNCKNHVAKYVRCGVNELFDEVTKKCDAGSEYNSDTFCFERTDGHYRNPWNCHGFVSCVGGHYFEQSCPENLVYDPYNNICEYPTVFKCEILKTKQCSFIPSCTDTKNRCLHAPDGKYPIRDVFKYLQCKNHTEIIGSCAENEIFKPSKSDCVPASQVTRENFCEDRTKCFSNWRDPWNCHKFLTCLLTHLFTQDCATQTLVYDPDTNHCLYGHQVKCVTVNTDSISTQDSVSLTVSPGIKDICTNLPDGKYAPRNVFNILVCDDHHSKVMNCPKGEIYVPGNVDCTDAKDITEDNFCVNRTDGNWLNPWDCHSFYTCSNGILFKQKCPGSLIYDPTYDKCDHVGETPCKVLGPKFITFTSQSLVSPIQDYTDKDPCTYLPDGNYGIRDVFTIMVCKDHVHTFVSCPEETIYVPGNSKCSPVSSVSMDTFCKHRTDGNWRNPWNCQHYITCHAGHTFDRKCSIKTILYYNPYLDLCAYPFQYSCKQVHQKTITSSPQRLVVAMQDHMDKDPCTYLPDGNYGIRDVFTIMVCKNHAHILISCPKETIYVPGNSKCSPVSSVSMDTFCKQRTDGNWRNPWNCQHYITCHAGHTFDRKCSIKTTLYYNPYLDLCAYPFQYSCKQVQTSISQSPVLPSLKPSVDNLCKDRPDGKYAVRDVFKYLVCKDHKDSYVSCPDNQYFSPSFKSCISKKEGLDLFCVKRSIGNWRDPWNCHGYITCVGHYAYERPCSKLTTLNYDPDNDLCEYPKIFPCKQLASSKDMIPNVIEEEEYVTF